MVRGLVLACADMKNPGWSSDFAEQGYAQVEEDQTERNTGQPGSNIPRKVAFWKERDRNGVVVVGSSNDNSATSVYTIGNAGVYFAQLGFDSPLEDGQADSVTVNGREFPAYQIRDSMKFLDYLRKERKRAATVV